MAKGAMVRFFWTKSPSMDLTGVKLVYSVNGSETVIDLPASVEEYSLTSAVPASATVSFRVDTLDSEGGTVTSETHVFTLGDLEAPLPATNLGHEIVAIVDMPDNGGPTPPPEPPPPTEPPVPTPGGAMRGRAGHR